MIGAQSVETMSAAVFVLVLEWLHFRIAWQSEADVLLLASIATLIANLRLSALPGMFG